MSQVFPSAGACPMKPLQHPGCRGGMFLPPFPLRSNKAAEARPLLLMTLRAFPFELLREKGGSPSGDKVTDSCPKRQSQQKLLAVIGT